MRVLPDSVTYQVDYLDVTEGRMTVYIESGRRRVLDLRFDASLW